MNNKSSALLEAISKFLSLYSKPDMHNEYQKKILTKIMNNITSSYNAIVEIDMVSICACKEF